MAPPWMAPPGMALPLRMPPPWMALVQRTRATHRAQRAGASPGNQNARKHGFYSKSLTPEQQEAIVEARKADILTEEIAFMRVKVQALVDDPNHDIDQVFRGIGAPCSHRPH